MTVSSRCIHLVYLTPRDIQVARVDRQSIVYFCSALARQHVSVELVAPGIALSPSESVRSREPLGLYRLANGFPVDIVRTSLNQDSPSWLVGLSRFRVHLAAAWKRIRQRDRDELLVFYIKNYAPTLGLLVLRQMTRGFLIAFEAHVPPKNRLQWFVLKRVDVVVANSYALANELGTNQQLADGRVIGLHQGVDLGPFSSPVNRDELRETLSLPGDRPLVVYTGKIARGYKEVDYILDAAAAVPEAFFVLVGGREDHVVTLRQRVRLSGLENVSFTGFVAPTDVHRYQRAADVLLLYYASGVSLNRYRSPGKLFEYMASGVPIVAVDLPVLREVLGDPPAAELAPADNPRELAAAISRVLVNRPAALAVAAKAERRVRRFTWDERARRVIAHLETLSG
jgi:glycosyltransferase involved in cell wall biosynthesis